MLVTILQTFISHLLNLSPAVNKSENLLQQVQLFCQFLQHFDPKPSYYFLLGGGSEERQLAKGDPFNTYPEASESIKKFCERNYHPIKIARSTIYDNTSPDFYYKCMVFACVHYGIYKGRGTGIRQRTKTHCTGCLFMIKFRLFFEPYMHYQIYYINLKHNHEIGPKIFIQYNRNRSLNYEEREFVKQILMTNAKNGEIRLFVQEYMNKMVTKSDISNVYSNYKKEESELFANKKNVKFDKQYFSEMWIKQQEPKMCPLASVEANSQSFNSSHCSSNLYNSQHVEFSGYDSHPLEKAGYDTQQFENMGYDPQLDENVEYVSENVEVSAYDSQRVENTRCDSQHIKNNQDNWEDPNPSKEVITEGDVSFTVRDFSSDIGDSSTSKKNKKCDGPNAYPTIKYLTEKLAHVLSQYDGPELKDRLHVVAFLTDAWKNNQNILLFKEHDNTYTECLEGSFTLVEQSSEVDGNLDDNPDPASENTNTEGSSTNPTSANLDGPGSNNLYILGNVFNEFPSKNQVGTDAALHTPRENYLLENTKNSDLDKSKKKTDQNLDGPSKVPIRESSSDDTLNKKANLNINAHIKESLPRNSNSFSENTDHGGACFDINAPNNECVLDTDSSNNHLANNENHLNLSDTIEECAVETSSSVHLRKNETYANLILNAPSKEHISSDSNTNLDLNGLCEAIFKSSNNVQSNKSNIHDNAPRDVHSIKSQICDHQETPTVGQQNFVLRTKGRNLLNSKHFSARSIAAEVDLKPSSFQKNQPKMKNIMSPLSVLTMKQPNGQSGMKSLRRNASVNKDKADNKLACEVLEVLLTEDDSSDISTSSEMEDLEASHNLDSECDYESVVTDVATDVGVSSYKKNVLADKSSIQSVFSTKPGAKLSGAKRCLKIQHKPVSTRKRIKISTLKDPPSESGKMATKKSKTSTAKVTSPENKTCNTSSCAIQSVAPQTNSGTIYVIQDVGGISHNLTYNSLPNMGMNTILVNNPVTSHIMLNQPNISPIQLQNNLPTGPGIIIKQPRITSIQLQNNQPNSSGIILNQPNVAPIQLQSNQPTTSGIILNPSNVPPIQLQNNQPHSSSLILNQPNVAPIQLQNNQSTTSGTFFNQPNVAPIELHNEQSTAPIIMQTTPSEVLPANQPPINASKQSNCLILPRPNRFILPFPVSEKETEVPTSEAQNCNENRTVATQTPLSSNDITPGEPRTDLHKNQADIKIVSSGNIVPTIPFTPLHNFKSINKDGNDIAKNKTNPPNSSDYHSDDSDTASTIPRKPVYPPKKGPDENAQTGVPQNPTSNINAKIITSDNLCLPTPLKPSLRINPVIPRPPENSSNIAVASVPNKIIQISLLQEQLTEMRKMTTQKKLQNLKNSLTVADIEDVVSERMLNDKIINLGQVLIKVKFPTTCGLQDVLLGTTLKFKVVKSNFIQIIHCGSFPHWLTVSTINAPPATAYVYDSLNEPIPQDAVPQICNIMNIESLSLTVISKPMQVQINNVDCGFFALASAITLLGGKDPSQTIYDVQAMRQHLLSGLMKNDLHEFPTLKNGIVVRSLGITETFLLHCVCRQPLLENTTFEQLKNPFQCSVCKKFYHKECNVTCCNTDTSSSKTDS